MARKKKQQVKSELKVQIQGILLIALAVFAYAGLRVTANTGEMGMFVNNVLRTAAGDTAIVIPFIIGVIGLQRIMPGEILHLRTRLLGVVLLLVLVMVSAHLKIMVEEIPADGSFIEASLRLGMAQQGGGILGALLATALFFLFKDLGSYIILGTAALIAVLLITDVSVPQLVSGAKLLGKFIARVCRSAFKGLKDLWYMVSAPPDEEWQEEEAAEDFLFSREEMETPLFPRHQLPPLETEPERLEPSRPELEDAPLVFPVKQKKTARPEAAAAKEDTAPQQLVPKKEQFRLPTLDLLTPGNKNKEFQGQKAVAEQARTLERTLASFGVRARVVQAQTGPVVTRFELQPDVGVKVSRILSLADDIALNLAAPDIRIEAPIPGKAAIGIEVPNRTPALVLLRDVLEDQAFINSPSPLTIALGFDIAGAPVITDLLQMPHLLIAGSTGAGKSVCLNCIITSILFKARPDEVKMMMIDPKFVELSIYNDLPHMISPVVTDPKKAAMALRSMVQEMQRRYEIFAAGGVKNIAQYNRQCREEEQLPLIVVIIDELADLMMVAPGEVEDSIARLAQMARAAGIHLVIATQRPSVDVITGVIKANITSRIAFAVSSQADSRTILDMGGAEKLLGRGDMLFYPVGVAKPFRVQGAFLSESDLQALVNYIKTQQQPDYDHDYMKPVHEEELFERDELFPEAVMLVAQVGQASISLLQRRFRIGYTRAARMIDDLERWGVVGPHEGSKPREVLVTEEQARRYLQELDQQDPGE